MEQSKIVDTLGTYQAPPPKMLLQPLGPHPSFYVQGKQVRSTESIGQVARLVPRITLGRVTGIAATSAGITITSTSTTITIVDHVAHVRHTTTPSSSEVKAMTSASTWS